MNIVPVRKHAECYTRKIYERELLAEESIACDIE